MITVKDNLPQNIHCFLCRGIFMFSQDGKRYKEHLVEEHRVYFHSKWIITRTLKQEKILESKKVKNINVVQRTKMKKIKELQNGNSVQFGNLKITTMKDVETESATKISKINKSENTTKESKMKKINKLKTENIAQSSEMNENEQLETNITLQSTAKIEDFETENTAQSPKINNIIEVKSKNTIKGIKVTKIENSLQSSKMYKAKEVRNENSVKRNKIKKVKSTELKRKLLKTLNVKKELKADMNIETKKLKSEIVGVFIKSEIENTDADQNSDGGDYIFEESKYNNKATMILKSDDPNEENTYSCSLCPEHVFSSEFEGKQHVLQHVLKKDDDNSNNKISKHQPSVTSSRSSNDSKIFGCSFCPNKSFSKRIYALQHVTQTKKHEYTKLNEDDLNAILEANQKENEEDANWRFCPQCGKNFATDESCAMHREKCTGDFSCSECPQKYGSLHSLQNHSEINHTNVAVECTSCRIQLFGNATLEYHQSICPFYLGIATEEFYCTVCPRRFASRSPLTKHMKLCGKNDALKCRHCEKSFERIVLVSEHENNCQENINADPLNQTEEGVNFKCKLCQKVFDTIENVIEHEKFCDNTKPEDTSEFVKYEEVKLKRRIRKDKSAYYIMGSFSCTDCNFSTRNYVSLKTHCFRMHPEAKLECLGCNVVLYGEATMEVHANRCNFMKKEVETFWQCDKACERKFDSKASSVNHIRVCGSAPMDRSCPMCNKQFGLTDRLRAHIVKCKGEPAHFSCCDTDYPSFKPFLQHQKIVHEFKVDENSETCPICGKVLKTQVLMMMHLRNRHFSKAASETFPCPREDCGKILSQKKSLNCHMESHTKNEIISN